MNKITIRSKGLSRRRSRIHGYKITVAGHLDELLRVSFPDLTAQAVDEEQTVLTGALPDQAALIGVLLRIHHLGLSILNVGAVRSRRRWKNSKDE